MGGPGWRGDKGEKKIGTAIKYNKMYLRYMHNTENVEHIRTKTNVYLTEWLPREKDEKIKINTKF